MAKLSVVDLVAMWDEAKLKGAEAAAQFKKDHIDPLKGNADKIEALREEVTTACAVRFFLKDRKVNGKTAAVGSDLMEKIKDAYYAAKGVKLTTTQKAYRKAVMAYANNIWADFKNGGVKKAKRSAPKSDTSKSDASKTETTGAVSNPEGADKGAIVQGQGVTAVELATAVYNWLAVHRDPNDRGDMVRELGAVLAEVSKWKVNQAVELRQVI